jgi:predicted nuclease of predicted toxin-antitoxin system
MRFLVDECTGPAVAQWLRGAHHDVFSVFEQGRGMDDDEVIRRAFAENRILVTNDKDFGEKVYRDRHPHRGIVLLRPDNECAENKIAVMQRLLNNHADRLADQFVVVTETTVRFARQ